MPDRVSNVKLFNVRKRNCSFNFYPRKKPMLKNILLNTLRISLTSIGITSYLLLRLFGKKADLNVVKAIWWENEIIRKVNTVAAKLDARAHKDKTYMQRHQALFEKVRYFLSLVNIRQDMNIF